jgi:amidohydrolase
VDLRAHTTRLATRRPVVATIAQLRAGEAANVTPEVAHLAGTLRALDEDDRRMLLGELQALATRVAGEHGTQAELVYGAHCPALSCDADATAVVRAALTEPDTPATLVAAEPSTAADDMARYLREVAGCYFRVGASDDAVGPANPHHHPLFDIDERALPVGVYCLARAAIALLAEPAPPY